MAQMNDNAEKTDATVILNGLKKGLKSKEDDIAEKLQTKEREWTRDAAREAESDEKKWGT